MPKVAEIHASKAVLAIVILNVISGIIIYFVIEQLEMKRGGKSP